VERSATIAAPPERVFNKVQDFHAWEAWSPWAKMDPAMKTTYSGAPAGTGAVYDWSGNDDVGTGRMTIVETKPAQDIHIKLEFFKPWEALTKTRFQFQPEGNGTKVTWRMDGTNTFMSKAMSLVMNMDEMIGKDFERGLAELKAQSEKGG